MDKVRCRRPSPYVPLRWRKDDLIIENVRASRKLSTPLTSPLQLGRRSPGRAPIVFYDRGRRASGRRRLSCAAGSYRNGDFLLVAAAILAAKSCRNAQPTPGRGTGETARCWRGISKWARTGISSTCTANGRRRSMSVPRRKFRHSRPICRRAVHVAEPRGEGTGFITETVFENRFMHVPELSRMGARAEIQQYRHMPWCRNAFWRPKSAATDLRASASPCWRAVLRKAMTIVDRIYHIDRGYERIEDNCAR
ncbi:hypothetical protein KCP73_15540 [Salmonella enterica subsp. enterica]|nr:hypothetical protein KCP73_15540 [Salmonella enterica subsp. enterica]